MALNYIVMLSYCLQFLALASGYGSHPRCKASPGTKSWPSDSSWAKLNRTLSGQLIKTVPPGAVCHPSQPTFDPTSCLTVQTGWRTSKWHSENPVSLIESNWTNDTCIPIPTFPCSGQGYPIYVVNATKPDDVKKGVDFARRNNVRLIVKGTGHDYLGRSAAPNSLSIWTHNIRGLDFFDKYKFKPKHCRKSVETAAIRIGAGAQMLEIDEQAALRNLTIVSGGAGTVGVGGFLTGGGHGAISSTYGLGADQVVEVELVTPSGAIVTANECQHEDLFWAVRGGGGSTFGVITSITMKAYPSFSFATALSFFGTPLSSGEAYWDAIATVYSRFPVLADKGISAYTFTAPNFPGELFNLSFPIKGFYGSFMLPILSPANSSDSLVAEVEAVIAEAKKDLPDVLFLSSVTGQTSKDFWSYYKDHNGPLSAGNDEILGSWLLDGEALTGNKSALRDALKGANEGGILSGHLVSGKGVHHAKIPGGSNSVNPAWRKAYLHLLRGVQWSPFDTVEKKKQEDLVTNVYVEALRKLAPKSGAYINEADPNQPNFQRVFWGDNYKRLLRIKKRIDPEDVFWCHPCVGNEGREVVDDLLCRV